MLDLRPQPVGDARPGAPGPAGPLVGRRLRGGPGLQPGEPAAWVVAGAADLAAVDHDPHAVDGQAGLGDVGGEHDPAPAGRRRGQRQVLLGERQRAEQRPDVDVGRHAPLRAPTPTRRMSAAPGRNTSTSPASARSACQDGGRDRLGRRGHVGRAAASGRRPGAPGRRWRSTGAGGVAAAEQRRHAGGVERGRHGQERRSGRRPPRASRVRARARSVWRLRSWTSSKITRPMPGRDGSRWRRRVRMPSVTTSIRVPARPGARPGCGSRRCRRPPRPAATAMRRAAARVASRRGSSMTMRAPASHGSSRSRSGTTVVLPGARRRLQHRLPRARPARPGARRCTPRRAGRSAAALRTRPQSRPHAALPCARPRGPEDGWRTTSARQPTGARRLWEMVRGGSRSGARPRRVRRPWRPHRRGSRLRRGLHDGLRHGRLAARSARHRVGHHERDGGQRRRIVRASASRSSPTPTPATATRST